MASKYENSAILLLLTASLLAVAMANKNFNDSAGIQNWNLGFNLTGWPFKHSNCTNSSHRIIVGGSEEWHYGYNYAQWALQNGPFYLNDTLVWKYDPPNGTSRPHSVYLLPNYWSYKNCDLSKAKRIADPTQGGGEGFEFVLKRWQPYYFACGESNGIHCRLGMMKFFVNPLIRWHF